MDYSVLNDSQYHLLQKKICSKKFFMFTKFCTFTCNRQLVVNSSNDIDI